MSEHKKRAELREEANNPINFTCGVCKHVVPFKEGYECEYCGANKPEEVKEGVE